MFLQNCYIHKRTPELIEKVINLGYKYSNQYDETCDALHTRKESTYTKAHFVDEHYSDMDPKCEFDGIDCGENEELFLALISLRDDTDKDQWFIMDDYKGQEEMPNYFVGSLFKCDCDNAMDCFGIYEYHKATVSELINFFKNEFFENDR